MVKINGTCQPGGFTKSVIIPSFFSLWIDSNIFRIYKPIIQRRREKNTVKKILRFDVILSVLLLDEFSKTICRFLKFNFIFRVFFIFLWFQKPIPPLESVFRCERKRLKGSLSFFSEIEQNFKNLIISVLRLNFRTAANYGSLQRSVKKQRKRSIHATEMLF